MAYSTSNPPSLIAQRTGATGGGNVWAYVDGDDLGVVNGSGYFSNSTDLGMKAGDEVIHNDTTNGVINKLVMAAHTKGTAVGATCSDTEPVGESSIALSSAGTGTIVEHDVLEFSTSPGVYHFVTNAGDTDVSDGGTLTISPVLATATAAGTKITVQSNVLRAKAQNTRNVRNLTVASTLSISDSGTTYFLNTAGGFTTTLPAPMEGVNFRFVVKTAPTTAYIIAVAGGSDLGVGVMAAATAADAGAFDANADVINFVANQAKVGDWVDVVSDGTSWYFTGVQQLAAGVTTATT